MHEPQAHDRAVAFCCDRNYFHFALFMIRQIAFHNPTRTFDFVISTQEDLAVPEWAAGYGIVLHRAGSVDVGNDARLNAKASHLIRMLLARELGDRYRRILYLDCDMFVEGGDIGRLLDVDLGPHPIGAVLDAPFFFEPNRKALEYAKLGLPAMPYANTGMQLIDTKAYAEQEVERRSLEQLRLHPEAILLTDQSMTNLALRGKFAQLAPCWNWQLNFRLPLVTMRYPVFLRHFIGPLKPDRESGGHFDARYNHAYREYLTRFFPEIMPALAPACDPVPMGLQDASRIVLRHLQARGLVEIILARHPDPYRALI